MADFGYEEGQTCWRNGCQGVIDTQAHVDGCCSCHISPPCGFCTTPRERCPVCDWQATDEKEERYIPIVPGLSEYVKGPHPRPLDPRKIDYRVHAHSGSSQICEGVYPEGTTQEEVRSRVTGTFGGRFEQFGNGTFRYIAYTD